MKKRFLIIFEASTVQMYLVMVVIVVKQVIKMCKCIYLACMAVKIEHTVDGHNHDNLQ